MKGQFTRTVYGMPLVMVAPFSVFAQTASPIITQYSVSKEREDKLETPNNGLLGGLAQPALAITAGVGSSDAKLTITTKRNDPNLLVPASGSLTLSAPLDEDTGKAAFLSEEGFPGKFSAEFAFTYITLPRGDFSYAREVSAKYQERCAAGLLSNSEYMRADQGEQLRMRLEKCPAINFLNKDELKKLDPEELKKVREFMGNYDPGADGRSELKAWRDAASFVFNFKAGMGYKNFSYRPSLGEDKRHRNKTPYSASFAMGYLPNAASWFFGGGISYKVDYKEEDKKVLCPAGTIMALTSCSNEIFDPPKKNIDALAFGFVRMNGLLGIKSPGWNPKTEVRLSYDMKDDIFGISMPVYAVMDDKGKLKGGVRLDWENKRPDSKKDRFRAAIFVVKSFDFTGI